ARMTVSWSPFLHSSHPNTPQPTVARPELVEGRRRTGLVVRQAHHELRVVLRGQQPCRESGPRVQSRLLLYQKTMKRAQYNRAGSRGDIHHVVTRAVAWRPRSLGWRRVALVTAATAALAAGGQRPAGLEDRKSVV